MLVLLADTRKKLLWLWLAAAAAVLALVFARTLAGAFEGIEGKAWLWAFVQLLPTLLLLFTAVLLNRNPSKVLKRSTFQALYFSGAAYLSLVLVSLLATRWAARNQSIEAYLNLSYCWLLPLQCLLLVLFGLLYFRKEAFFRPDAAIMAEFVSKKAEFAKRSGHLLSIQAFDLLVQDDGLDKVLAFLENTPGIQNNDLVVLQSQKARWDKARDLNLVAPDVLQRDLNNMTISVIDFIENMPI